MVFLSHFNSFYRDDGAIGWAAKQPPVTLETVKSVTQIEWHSTTPSAVVQNIEVRSYDMEAEKKFIFLRYFFFAPMINFFLFPFSDQRFNYHTHCLKSICKIQRDGLNIF